MYTQEITRCHRAAIVIAIDQSCSMSGRMVLNGLELPKAEVVSMVAGRLIDELIMRSNREGEFRHYYDIAIIGYSGDRVYSLLGEKLDFLPITELATRKVPRMVYALNYHTLKDGDTTFSEEVSRWVEPLAQGSTPMCRMLYKVTELVAKWCSRKENRESFPPIVINITDGEPTDCDDNELRDICAQVRRVATEDGETLLLNVHICTDWTLPSIVFPMPDDLIGAGRQARTLAECSSIMPSAFDDAIIELKGMGAVPPFYGMGYNASVIELLSIINIGSRSIINME